MNSFPFYSAMYFFPDYCPPLSLANGTVSYNRNAIPGSIGQSSVGTIASFTCHTGYSRFGPTSRTCQSSGNWSGQNPECRESNNFYVIVLTINIFTMFKICFTSLIAKKMLNMCHGCGQQPVIPVSTFMRARVSDQPGYASGCYGDTVWNGEEYYFYFGRACIHITKRWQALSSWYS